MNSVSTRFETLRAGWGVHQTKYTFHSNASALNNEYTRIEDDIDMKHTFIYCIFYTFIQCILFYKMIDVLPCVNIIVHGTTVYVIINYGDTL